MVSKSPLPAGAFLNRYAEKPDCYTDCYTRDVANQIDLATFIKAFYRTPLFGMERAILRVTVRRPSTDADITAIATGTTKRFAAWDVEDRNPTQLLLCDMGSHTRSWFMVAPQGSGTRLYFGSAVTPLKGPLMKTIMPFHKLYSRLLLTSAKI